MARKIGGRHPRDAMLLSSGDRGPGQAESKRPARLDLDEHEHAIVARNDVNFSVARAEAASENCVPATTQFRAREIFAGFPECAVIGCGHVAGESKSAATSGRAQTCLRPAAVSR